jgi:hypothetical protein
MDNPETVNNGHNTQNEDKQNKHSAKLVNIAPAVFWFIVGVKKKVNLLLKRKPKHFVSEAIFIAD